MLRRFVSWFENDPTTVVQLTQGIIVAGFAVLSSFDVGITASQRDTIIGLLWAILTFVSTLIIKTKTTPNATIDSNSNSSAGVDNSSEK